MEKRVTGLGGIFFKSEDVQKTKEWYRRHLGFSINDWGATFLWGDTDENKRSRSKTIWSPFKADTTYFAPGDHPYMINYRVHDLENLLQVLQKENVEISGAMETYSYGKFGWIIDPEKRKIELWQPIEDEPDDEPIPTGERVTGIGGVFFKSDDPKKLTEWYTRHLGVGAATFRWKDLNAPEANVAAHTIWAPFKKDTTYFSPGDKPYMFNYRVKDLTALLASLKAEGVQQLGDAQEHPYGKFAWIQDVDGAKVELWEPKDEGFESSRQ